MRQARIRGALVGVESVTPEGLKDVYKDFNVAGDQLVARLQQFRRSGLHVLGSFIFGLPSDRPDTFDATVAIADRAEVAFAQFVMLTPLPGTIDFNRWEEEMAKNTPTADGVPLTRYWLIPPSDRPKVYFPHPVMSADEVRRRTQLAWDHFYSLPSIWRRSDIVGKFRDRLAFVLVSKLYRQMYANTGNRHRQRPGLPRNPVGAVAGQTSSAAVCGPADAGAPGSRPVGHLVLAARGEGRASPNAAGLLPRAASS